MGEFAIRKHDGEQIKIGTCEELFYLRYEDRGKIDPLPGNVNPQTDMGLYFRLPFPDEDQIRPGDYRDYRRGVRLALPADPYGDTILSEEEKVNAPGVIQLAHPSGLLLNVPCYHGVRLPDGGPDIQAHWNGRTWHLELRYLKTTPEGIQPVFACRFCNTMWRGQWHEVVSFLPRDILGRLQPYYHADTLACRLATP